MINNIKTYLQDPLLVRPDWTISVNRDKSALWLDKNENLDPFLSKAIQDVMREINPIALSSYPDFATLYKRLAEVVGVPSNYLALTAGSDGAIKATFEVFVSPGDVVIHTSPTFAMYTVYCRMFGAKASAVNYRVGPNGPLLTPLEILGAIKNNKPKLVCIPNPDSPTGSVLNEGDLRKIIETCREVNSVILIDEAYYPFSSQTCVPWVAEYKNLIVARTFAKAWGLAGLRIGYVVACPETIEYFHKVRPMYEVSTVAGEIVLAMLSNEDQMLQSVQRLKQGGRYFSDEMSFLGFKCIRGAGNFLHVSFGAAENLVHQALDGHVLYRKNFTDECLQGYSRFSFTTTEQFESIVRIIKKALTEGNKK